MEGNDRTPLDSLRLKANDKGYFEAGRDYSIVDLCVSMGKWPAEFRALPSEEQAELLAYLGVKAKMDRWQQQKAEEDAKRKK